MKKPLVWFIASVVASGCVELEDGSDVDVSEVISEIRDTSHPVQAGNMSAIVKISSAN